MLLLSLYGKPEEASSNIREGMPQQQAKEEERLLLPCLGHHQKVPLAEEFDLGNPIDSRFNQTDDQD